MRALVIVAVVAACTQRDHMVLVWPDGMQTAQARYPQVARPDVCTGTDQPEVVDLRAQPDGSRLPIWACAHGCLPGEEYVTRVIHNNEDVYLVEPTCTDICGPGRHRVAYVTLGDGSCADGPSEPASIDDAIAREQTRLLAPITAELERTVRALAQLDSAPRPWSATSRDLWRDQVSTVVSGRHHSVRFDIWKASRRSAQLRALADDIEAHYKRLEPAAEEASELANRATADAALRDEHLRCTSACEEQRTECRTRCRGLTEATCRECDPIAERCTRACI